MLKILSFTGNTRNIKNETIRNSIKKSLNTLAARTEKEIPDNGDTFNSIVEPLKNITSSNSEYALKVRPPKVFTNDEYKIFEITAENKDKGIQAAQNIEVGTKSDIIKKIRDNKTIDEIIKVIEKFLKNFEEKVS